jgi:hypothetical protein
MSAEDFAAVREYINGHKIVVDEPDGRFTYQIAPSARPTLAALASIEERLREAERRMGTYRTMLKEAEAVARPPSG